MTFDIGFGVIVIILLIILVLLGLDFHNGS